MLITRWGKFTSVIISLMAFSLVSACTADVEPLVTTETITTETPAPISQAPTTTLTISPPTATQAGPTILTIWWPEAFAPSDNNEALAVLSDQINDFESAQNDVVVQMRLKRESDVGGIMSTLLTANSVAPGALPDLTLIRRHDLLDAVQSRLIYPVEGRISSAVLGDLYDAALQLGQVDSAMYGVPYILDIQHTIYHADQVVESWDFTNMLASPLTFAFPAAQASGASHVFLTQYIDASRTLPTADEASINERALLEVLSFYEEALVSGSINASVLNYTAPSNYTDLLISGEMDAGVVTSTTYLRLLQADDTFKFGPVPTLSGSLIGEIDGWIWVLTTSSADRQALAISFLNWMLNANRQGQYSQTLKMLPSQQSALQQWENNAYREFASELLENALQPVGDTIGSAVARAMQNALVTVLTGQSTAEEATQAVMSQFAD